jgi:hypothetical protein
LKFIFELFSNLRSLTFEDRTFNTGLIITRSHRSYSSAKKAGTLITLNDPVQLTPISMQNKRFWYLADGSSCYYVCDQKLQVFRMFFLDPEAARLLTHSTYFLKKALDNRDIAFRTIQGKEMVAVAATGEEFIYTGTQWMFRNHNLIRMALGRILPLFLPAALDSLISLIFTKISNRHGALIWIPREPDRIDPLILNSSRIWQHDLDIDDPRYAGLIRRLASSDGALVLSPVGRVTRFGTVANLATACAQDVAISGAGSIAAQFLSQSGVVIKVSQDGIARVYTEGKMRWEV